MRKKKSGKLRINRGFEWAIIKREKATGKVIKTISLDPETEIPEGVTNFSEYVRDLMKQDVESRKQAEAAVQEPKVAEETLMDAELELYGWLDNWAYFHKYGFEKYGSVHEYLMLQPDRDTLLNLLTRLDVEIEKCQKNAEQQSETDRAEHFKVPRMLIQAVKKDPQLWNNVYDKFRKHWHEEHPQPEAYSKEVLRFEGKSWTGADILEKVLPHVDLHAAGNAETGHQTTTKEIAEIFHVDYQTAYNKIVPRIGPILEDAGVKII